MWRDFSVGQASFACFSSVSSHKHAALRSFCLSNRNTDVELQQHRLVLAMVILLRRFTLLQYGRGGGNHAAHGESSCSLRTLGL